MPKQTLIGLLVILVIIIGIGFWITRSSEPVSEPVVELDPLAQLFSVLKAEQEFAGEIKSADLDWQVQVDNEIRTLTFSGLKLNLPTDQITKTQNNLIDRNFMVDHHNAINGHSDIITGYQKADLVCLLNHSEAEGSLSCAQANSAHDSSVNYSATVAQLLMKKYELSNSDLSVIISHEGKNHLRGSYLIITTDQVGNFLAAKVDNRWTLISDGNETLSCQLVEGYGFPFEMVKDCSEDQDLTVTVDEEFTIELDSNPTTGYDWEVTIDNELVNLIGKEYQAHEAEMIGAGGRDIFIFKAKQTGTTILKFWYQRPWESTQPLKNKQYNVTIN